MRVSKAFNGDPVIKVGGTVSYKAGYVYVSNVNTCFPYGFLQCGYVVDNKASSQTTTWTVVDEAASLVMTGVAAAIFALAF